MKDETHTFELIDEIIALCALNQSNRIMVLEWCSELTEVKDDAQPIQCGPLDPDSVRLIYTAKTATLVAHTPSLSRREETLALGSIDAFINQVIERLIQHGNQLTPLPNRLARLFKWHHRPQGPLASNIPALPSDITSAKRVFYTSTWQHYMPKPFVVRRARQSILVLSRSQTQLLNLDSGQVLTQYQGHCVYDSYERLYRVSDSELCHLDRQGKVRWRSPIQFESLPLELYASDDSVIVMELSQLTSLDITTGRRNWCVEATVIGLKSVDEWLYSLELADGVIVNRRLSAMPNQVQQLYQAERVIQYWWLDGYLVLCPTQRVDDLCTHIVFINLNTGRPITHRIPPLRPISIATSEVSIVVLFAAGNERHILRFHRHQSDARLFALSLPAVPTQIIHFDEPSIIIACRGNALLSMQIQTLSIEWFQQLQTEFTIELEHTLLHQHLLIVPGGPILVIDSKSGRILSEIDDPLYANARPLLVDEQRILLHDEAGYLGQFTVQGHIGLATLDAQKQTSPEGGCNI